MPKRSKLSEPATAREWPATAAPLKASGQAGAGKSPIVHQTLYLRRSVYRQLRQVAAVRECKMHDLVLEGLDMVFRANGMKAIADLDD